MDLPFERAIRNSAALGRMAVIAEIKARSGHGEDLLGDQTPTQLAVAYAEGGAVCLSVVTGSWFGGTPSLLDEVLRATELPVLCKDFIRSPEQVQFWADRGAAALLVTARLLPAVAFDAVLAACEKYKVSAFVEVANEKAVERALSASVSLVAINNRDIESRELRGEGIGRSLRLKQDRTPATLWVSASGIVAPADLAPLSSAGFSGVLVGTALLKAKSPFRATADFVGAGIFGGGRRIIKVCGVSSEAEVDSLSAVRVDLMGLCVFPGKPYSLTVVQAALLSNSRRGPAPVLVTLERTADPLFAQIDRIRPAAVQLSGLNGPDLVTKIRARYSPAALKIIQTVHVMRRHLLEEAALPSFAAAGADLFLLERFTGHALGSSGTPITPADIATFESAAPSLPFLVAGGIRAATVEAQLSGSAAAGIDVCSGVRNTTGISPQFVADLVAAVRRRTA